MCFKVTYYINRGNVFAVFCRSTITNQGLRRHLHAEKQRDALLAFVEVQLSCYEDITIQTL